MSSTYKNVVKLPLKYVSHIYDRKTHIAPTQNVSSIHKTWRLFSSHSVSCKCRSSRYFDQFKNSLIIHQIENSIYETLASIWFTKPACCTGYNSSSTRKLKNTQFCQPFTNASKYLTDSSIATYRSQPFWICQKHPLWQIELYVFLWSFIPSL